MTPATATKRIVMLTLNIGPPRTATTTLQKHFFPSLDQYYVLQKKPYKPLAAVALAQLKPFFRNESELLSLSINSLGRWVAKAEPSAMASTQEARSFLFSALWAMSTIVSTLPVNSEKRERGEALIQQILRLCLAATTCGSLPAGILLASESLGSSAAALAPTSRVVAERKEHEIDVIARAWREGSLGETPRISFCLREPIAYVASRYIRYTANCHYTSKTPLSPSDWVALQVQIDKQNRAQSALFPALHKSYLIYYNRIGYTHAYGFKALLQSEDVCALLGLEGQSGIGFPAFPRENDLISDPKSKTVITQDIRDALDAHDYLPLLQREQMYE